MANKTMTSGLMSSDRQDWETPQEFVELIEKKLNFKFDLDSCAYDHTAKAPKWYTEEDDALKQDWTIKPKTNVWMNPPYGGALPTWLEYAYNQSQIHDSRVVCLIPARTDTAWFHDIATRGLIVFLRGRIKFQQQGEKTGSPAFPSMLVIFDGHNNEPGFKSILPT